jgi:hypothetical protein
MDRRLDFLVQRAEQNSHSAMLVDPVRCVELLSIGLVLSLALEHQVRSLSPEVLGLCHPTA